MEWRLHRLLVQQHSDSTVMEDAINGILNEAAQCLCNQKVPFSSRTYSNKQRGSENSGEQQFIAPELLLINHAAVFAL